MYEKNDRQTADRLKDRQTIRQADVQVDDEETYCTACRRRQKSR
jgi:hypothetical protein